MGPLQNICDIICQKSSRSQVRMGFLHEWVEGYYYCFTFLFLSGRCNNQNQSRVTSCPYWCSQQNYWVYRIYRILKDSAQLTFSCLIGPTLCIQYWIEYWVSLENLQSHAYHWKLPKPQLFNLWIAKAHGYELAKSVGSHNKGPEGNALLLKSNSYYYPFWENCYNWHRHVAYITNFTSGNPLSVLNVL